jgi:hypothetical protein
MHREPWKAHAQWPMMRFTFATTALLSSQQQGAHTFNVHILSAQAMPPSTADTVRPQGTPWGQTPLHTLPPSHGQQPRAVPASQILQCHISRFGMRPSPSRPNARGLESTPQRRTDQAVVKLPPPALVRFALHDKKTVSFEDPRWHGR